MPASAVAAARRRSVFFIGFTLSGWLLTSCREYFAYLSGTKDLPSEAGVLMSVILRFSDMITSTAIVAR
jgi:hypothetical protein